jgi:hypothetical protein
MIGALTRNYLLDFYQVLKIYFENNLHCTIIKWRP